MSIDEFNTEMSLDDIESEEPDRSHEKASIKSSFSINEDDDEEETKSSKSNSKKKGNKKPNFSIN